MQFRLIIPLSNFPRSDSKWFPRSRINVLSCYPHFGNFESIITVDVTSVKSYEE